MIARFLSLVLIVVVCGAFAENVQTFSVKKTSTESLKRQADAVLKLDNVSARADIDVVFKYADRLLEEGRDKEAQKYLAAGLKHYPWDLPHQLDYAKLLMKDNQQDLAKERLKLITEYAEDDTLCVEAMKLLGINPDTALSPMSAITQPGPVLVLLALDAHQPLFLKELGEAMHKELGIPVIVQAVNFKYPPVGRDRYGDFCAAAKEAFKEELSNPNFQNALQAADMTEEDLDDDDKVIALLRMVSIASEKNKVSAGKKFDNYVATLKAEPKQWDVDPLLTEIHKCTQPYQNSGVRYVAITDHDIYGDDSNFLFGQAQGKDAVMSYIRFTGEFNDQIPNRQRFLKRAKMQCLSSTGWVFGLKRCSDPTCAKAYPNSLAEHDAKSGHLCSECKAAFNKAFNAIRQQNGAVTKPAE